jgi:hypothetical protein
MTAPLFSFLNDKGNKSYNSILQVRKELSVRPTHNKCFHPVAVKKVNKAAVWASNKNRIDFNTVGLERKSIPVTAVVSHTLNSLKEEIAVDVMVKTGVRARRETHYNMKPITVVSPVVVRFA